MLCLVLTLFAVSSVSSSAIVSLNESEYNRMPPLFHLDPYEPCVRNGGIYCDIQIELVSDTPNELMSLIQDYSTNLLVHFNHSILHYGVCVTQKCNVFLHSNKTLDLRLALERCMNESMYRDYELRTHIEEEPRCNINGKTKIKSHDITVAYVIITILLLNLLGTMHEYLPKEKQYAFLINFSIITNWKKLMAPIDSENLDERLLALKPFYGLRVLFSSCMIIVHSFTFVIIANATPHFIEEECTILVKLLLTICIGIQVYFVMSGYLLSYHTLLYQEKVKVTWAVSLKLLLLRWIKFSPFICILAVTVTWMRLQWPGPLWQKAMRTPSEDCKHVWWRYMIYINNYGENLQCLPETWYLATDVQLTIVGLILCVVVKSAALRTKLIVLLLLVGMIVPAVNTYINDSYGVMLLNVEAARNFLAKDAAFNNYKQGHNHIIGYLQGIVLGYVVYDLQKTGFDIKKYQKPQYYLLYYVLIICGFSVPAMFGSSIADGVQYSLLTRVSIAAFEKILYGVVVCAFYMSITFKFTSGFVRFLNWSIFVPLNRVTFCAYIIHMMVIKLVAGTRMELMELSFINMIFLEIGLLIGVQFMAFVFYLLVQAPLIQTIKIVLDRNGWTPETLSRSKKSVSNCKLE